MQDEGSIKAQVKKWREVVGIVDELDASIPQQGPSVGVPPVYRTGKHAPLDGCISRPCHRSAWTVLEPLRMPLCMPNQHYCACLLFTCNLYVLVGAAVLSMLNELVNFT